MAMKSKSGGGITSNKLTSRAGHTPARHQGVTVHSNMDISRIGQQTGNHATDSGKTLPNKPQSAVHFQGAGANTRPTANVHGCGSQSQHGPVAGTTKPAGRDILGSFGPDSPNVRGR
jgi:hypothetical protein